MERKHLIYVFVDDRQIPFYVGRTYDLSKRKREHLREVKYGNTLPKYNKLRKLIDSGQNFDNLVFVLEKDIPSNLIEEREIYHIARLREEGYSLKNLTDGGEGAINTIPGLSEKLKKIHTGAKRSQQTKDRISAAKQGKAFSKIHKKNLSIARKKRVIKIETRNKCSKTSKGTINIKQYKLTDPNGKEYFTEHGLKSFCEEHNLNHPNFFKVLKGERSHVKGWMIQYVS